MNVTRAPDPTPDEVQTRLNIVTSLVNNDHRDPGRNLELIRGALAGATVQDLFDMERLGIGFGEI